MPVAFVEAGGAEARVGGAGGSGSSTTFANAREAALVAAAAAALLAAGGLPAGAADLGIITPYSGQARLHGLAHVAGRCSDTGELACRSEARRRCGGGPPHCSTAAGRGPAWARPTLEAGAVIVQEHRGCARGHASVRVQREPACGAARRARARRAQVQELQAALERALRPGQLRRADGASALEVKTVDGFQVGGFQGSTRWVGSRVPGGLQLGGFQGYRWVPGFQARARTRNPPGTPAARAHTEPHPATLLPRAGGSARRSCSSPELHCRTCQGDVMQRASAAAPLATPAAMGVLHHDRLMRAGTFLLTACRSHASGRVGGSLPAGAAAQG